MPDDREVPPLAAVWPHVAAIARRGAEAATHRERFRELRLIEQQLRGQQGDLVDEARDLLSISLKMELVLNAGQSRAVCVGLVAVAKAALGGRL